MQPFSSLIALLGCLTLASRSPAAEVAPGLPRGLAAAREFARTLTEQEEADITVFRAELATGVSAGLWTEDDRRLAEQDLDEGLAGMRKTPQPVLWKPFYTKEPPPRATTALESWLHTRLTQTASLRTGARTAECWETADFAEEVWCRAQKVQDLTLPLAALNELKTREPARWASITSAYIQFGSNRPPLPGARTMQWQARDPFYQPFDALTVLASADGFLPPDPAVDLPGYLRWRDAWQKLDAFGHRFVRRVGPARRFAQCEARYHATVATWTRQLVALLERNAPASEFEPALKPVSSFPSVVAGGRNVLLSGPPRQSLGMRSTTGRERDLPITCAEIVDALRRRASPPAFVAIPDEVPVRASKAILRLRAAQESGDAEAATAAQAELDAALPTLDPDLAAAVSKHLLAPGGNKLTAPAER